MSEPPPLVASLPPRRALIVIALAWAISVIEAARGIRGLYYICSIPPEPTLVDHLALWGLFTVAAGGAVFLYGWVRPETRAGRLGAALLSTLGSAFPCLLVYGLLLSFKADQAAALAGMGTVFLSLPSAIAMWAMAELLGWLWTREPR